MQQVQLNVADEIKALGDALVQEVADIKAAKGVAVYFADLVPALTVLGASYQSLGADIKSPDALGYLAKCVAQAFVPVAPVVQSPKPAA